MKAAAVSGERLVVAGGFTTLTDLSATGDIRFLQPIGLTEPDAGEQALQPRGGMAALLLNNDTILLAGGKSSEGDLGDTKGLLEIYTPSNLLPLE